MRRVPLSTLSLAALAVAVAAVGVFFLSRRPPLPEEIPVELPRPEPGERPRLGPAELPRGGVYAGIVVDGDEKPIADATVLLVAFDSGQRTGPRLPVDPDEFDPSLLPVIDFRTAGETRTDAAGRFRVAAGPDSAIRLIAAYHPGHVPDLVSVEGPGEGIRIQLESAGFFIGTVVDAESKRPVPGARVSVYLQQRAAAPAGAVGTSVSVTRRSTPLTPFGMAQRWVAKELGPRVWGLDWQGDEALHLFTDSQGVFRLGPLGDEVQLEFVITHPDYMWTEHDRTDRDTVERTVVPPGETVERTFLLERGKAIEGRVIDDKGRGVPDVLVSVEHMPQYVQHWWYRVKKRRARTGRDGSFRVGGLSWGPYTATLEHPSFGREFIPNIPDPQDGVLGGLVWHVEGLGGIEGRVEGLEETRFGQRVDLVLEALTDNPSSARHLRFTAVLRKDGTFLVPGVEPGRWRAWIRVGRLTSQPQEIEVEPLAGEVVRFELGGGGEIVCRVVDATGRIVDPAAVLLVRLEEDDAREQSLGRLVTRGGVLEASAIAPGRYRAEVSASGFLPERTEPFTIVEDGRVDLGRIVLRQAARLRIAALVRADGEPVTTAVTLSVREGEGAWRALPLLGGAEVLIRPGTVSVRATGADGTSYEAAFEVGDGETLPVRVVLSP